MRLAKPQITLGEKTAPIQQHLVLQQSAVAVAQVTTAMKMLLQEALEEGAAPVQIIPVQARPAKETLVVMLTQGKNSAVAAVLVV